MVDLPEKINSNKKLKRIKKKGKQMNKKFFSEPLSAGFGATVDWGLSWAFLSAPTARGQTSILSLTGDSRLGDAH